MFEELSYCDGRYRRAHAIFYTYDIFKKQPDLFTRQQTSKVLEEAGWSFVHISGKH